MSFEMPYETWSKGEKAIARGAFEQAYARECLALAGEVRRRAISIKEPSDMSTPLSIGCYCENESACHRSILRELIDRVADR